MANYNVDIAVAVKNTQAITQLSTKINQTSTKVDRLNEILAKFGNNVGGTVVNSVKNFSNQVNAAAKNLNKAALNSREATVAAKEFVKAVNLENAALKEQAALLAQVRNQGKSGTLRGGTQYKNPLGPFEASSIAPGAFKAGRGSKAAATEISGLLQRNLSIKEDDFLLTKKLREQEERSAQQLNEKISLQNRFNGAMRKGAAQAKALATQSAAAMGLNQPSGALGPGAGLKTQQIEASLAAKSTERLAVQQKIARESANTAFQTKLQLALAKKLVAAEHQIEQALDDQIDSYTSLNRQRERARERASADAKRNAPRSPIGGSVNIPGSPAARRAGRAGAGRGFQSAALGVGFPLLFGGGAGSIAGGLLGSAGGFGGQILGSAIGAQLDAFASSAAKLGQALDPVNGSLEDLVVASGNTGTAFGSLLVQMEEVLGKERAIEAATAQLATVIGTKGVTALRDFGRDTADLGNEFAKAVTQVTAAMAELINKTGFLKSLIEGLAKDNYVRAGMANDTDPELQRLKQQRKQIAVDVVRDNPYQSSEALEKALSAQDDLIAKRARELEIAKQIELTNQANADILNEKSALHNVNTNLLTAQLELEASGLDLTTDAGLALAEKVEARRTDVKLQEAINAGLSVELVLLQGAVALARLKKRAQAARDAASGGSGRNPIDKELNVQRALVAEEVKQNDLSVRLGSIGKDRLAVVQRQLASIDDQTALKEKQIMMSKDDERLQQAKLVTLSFQKDIQREQLKLEEQKIIKQRQLENLQQGRQQQRSLRGISTDITRQIADAGRLTTGNPSEDAQLELRISQVRRQEDAITQLTDALQDQRDIRSKLTEDQIQEIKTTDQEIINLTERIELTKQLLPQLDAAEQSQLRFNQALEAAKPFADAFTSGLLDGMVAVVDGTKTAEQAFADFLNSIADMLMQAAQQMIATYIAIGIAKMFAGMGGGTVGDGGTGPLAKTKTNFFGPAMEVFSRGYVGGKALGGSVSGNRPYLVGERGPELFVPGAQGNIVPNNAMGSANVTVNVDASGSSVEGDSANASQLGKAIGAAVQSELIKQKRPGGLLAR